MPQVLWAQLVSLDSKAHVGSEDLLANLSWAAAAPSLRSFPPVSAPVFSGDEETPGRARDGWWCTGGPQQLDQCVILGPSWDRE